MIGDQPELWPNGIEELLRFDTSVRSDPRVAADDLVLGDTVIPAGQNIVVMLGIANRDPRRFEDPDRLILDRDDPAPISFGHGIHYCVGANLARMELRMGLERLLEVLGDYTVDEESVVWKPSVSLRSQLSLPVRVG